MEIAFFNLNDDLDELRSALDSYFKSKTQNVAYQSIQNIKEDLKRKDVDVIFYQIEDAEQCIEFLKKFQCHPKKTKRVALCKSYRQGMKAVENGSSYALLLPLNEHDIIQCCVHITDEDK